MTRAVDMLVIGAGWAGLYAAKYAREAGLEVTIIEARDDIGGVWNYSDDPGTITVMRNTVSSSSRHVTEASDHSMGAAAGTFFRHEDALAYLRSYAARFGLTDRIVTGARVTECRKQDGLWQVHTVDGRRFAAHRLAVTTGVHQTRRPITGPVTAFGGSLIHAGDLKHPCDLGADAGDHVVVYGGGETAADIVHDLATQTDAAITWAIRGGQHFFRKAPRRAGMADGEYDRDDMALDEYSSALMGLLTTARKGTVGSNFIANLAGSGSVFAFQGHGQAAWANDIPWYKQFFNKNGHALDHVWSGRVTPQRGIAACDDRTVTFDDGSRTKASHVVCCFGYKADFGFLPEPIRAVPTDRLHRLVFHPDDPSLSFFGFARPTILSLPYIIEQQCLYACRVWSGKVALPDRATMHREAADDAASLDREFGYERRNRNLICPFWYLEVTMKAMQLDGWGRLWARFHPRKDWALFSRLLRIPASPLLLRLITSDFGPQERARVDEYVTPMLWRMRRDPDAGLLRYVLTMGAVIGTARLLRFDQIFDAIARRRMARTGRAIPLRPARHRIDDAVPVTAPRPAPQRGARSGTAGEVGSRPFADATTAPGETGERDAP